MEIITTILSIIVILIPILIICAWQPKILFSEESVKITGMFGMKIKREEIASVVIGDANLPSMFRDWALCLFGFNKGFFVVWEDCNEYNLKDNDTCKLYTQTNKPPFIVITLNDGMQIFINFRNKDLMNDYYLKLLEYGNTSENKN